ncbi:MAG TPA: HD domain-containing phosphohydrolase [Vicinamibacterales bacterium]
MPDTTAAPSSPGDSRPHPFVAGVIAVGAVVLSYSVWVLVTQPTPLALVVLLGLTAAAGWAALRVPSMPISFSISDTFSIAAALLIGPAAGAVTAALDGLILSFGMKNSSRTAARVMFNATAAAVANWVAAQAFLFLSNANVFIDGPLRVPRLLALLAVFGFLNFGLGTGLVATAVAFEGRKSILGIWRAHFVGLWVTHLGGIFATLLMLVLSDAQRSPMSTLEALLLITPLPVILYVNFRHALGRAEDQLEHLGGMNRVYVATIEALAQTVDAKDQVTHDHVRRVQDNSVRLAHELGVDDDLEIQALKAASLLHDVGKIAVPEHILNKPGRLSPSELEIMRRHAPVGADILSVIGFPYPVVPIVRHHHENWDGSGYPDGLTGDAIPIGARILSVVDCFDALTSDRPYRPRFDAKDALKVLADRSGTMYDPRVVDAFFALHAAGKNEMPPPLSAPVADPHAVSQAPAAVPDADAGRAEAMESFYELASALTREASAGDVGATLWAHLQRRLDATAFVLFVYEESADCLAPVFSDGAPTIATATRIRLGDRLSGWVAATRQVIMNSDARLDVDDTWRDQSRLQSAMAVPVCVDGRLEGVLAFYSDRAVAFSPSHQRIAEAAAFVAGRCLGRREQVGATVAASVSRPGTAVSRH